MEKDLEKENKLLKSELSIQKEVTRQLEERCEQIRKERQETIDDAIFWGTVTTTVVGSLTMLYGFVAGHNAVVDKANKAIAEAKKQAEQEVKTANMSGWISGFMNGIKSKD